MMSSSCGKGIGLHWTILCVHNTLNVELIYNCSQMNMNFLDIILSNTGTTISTKSYFKPTDRNVYIPLSSYHHPIWLKNTPERQFISIRGNCWSLTDYYSQSEVLSSRFVEKGYDDREIVNTIQQVVAIQRETFLEDRSFITHFSTLHF